MHILKDDFNEISAENNINTFKNLKLLAYIFLTFLNEKHSIVKEYEIELINLLFKYVCNDNYKSEISKKYFGKINYLYNIIPDKINDINEEKIKKICKKFLKQ